MFSSIAESLIQRVCGRYLKNFSSSNINISVTGVIRLTDIEVRVEELENFQLPYTPVRIFLGSVYADLPIVMGGNFDVRISDVLVVFERNSECDLQDATALHKALQAWIGAFFFSLAQQQQLTAGGTTGERAQISSSEVEYSQRLFERVTLSFSRIHARVEEIFSAHVACPIGLESLCSGVLIGHLEMRNPTTVELSTVAEFVKATTAAAAASSSAAVANKVVKCSDLQVYCTREDRYSDVEDGVFDINFVKKAFFLRKNGVVLSPCSLEMVFSCCYQRNNLVFGPIIAGLKTSALAFSLTDEQLSYMISVIHNCETHPHMEVYHHKYTTSAPQVLYLFVLSLCC